MATKTATRKGDEVVDPRVATPDEPAPEPTEPTPEADHAPAETEEAEGAFEPRVDADPLVGTTVLYRDTTGRQVPAVVIYVHDEVDGVRVVDLEYQGRGGGEVYEVHEGDRVGEWVAK